MILVTGGSFQGKRVSARQYPEERNADGAVWIEGVEASWEESMDGRLCHNSQLFVRRIMGGNADPSFREQRGPAVDQTPERLLEEPLVGPEDRILVADKIGCDIVPVDIFERLYREETGRLCCRVAGEADKVWRMYYGIGVRIK